MCSSGRVPKHVCVYQALAPTKIPKPHHATRDSRLEPVSPTFSPTFRPRFAHVSEWVLFFVGLVLGTIPWKLQQWGWNLRIFGSFRQFFRTFGAQNFTIQVTLAQQLGLLEHWVHKTLESTAFLVLGHVWSSMRKVPWNLQCFGVLNAWNPGSCSSFRPKMP